MVLSVPILKLKHIRVDPLSTIGYVIKKRVDDGAMGMVNSHSQLQTVQTCIIPTLFARNV